MHCCSLRSPLARLTLRHRLSVSLASLACHQCCLPPHTCLVRFAPDRFARLPCCDQFARLACCDRFARLACAARLLRLLASLASPLRCSRRSLPRTCGASPASLIASLASLVLLGSYGCSLRLPRLCCSRRSLPRTCGASPVLRSRLTCFARASPASLASLLACCSPVARLVTCSGHPPHLISPAFSICGGLCGEIP